MGGEGGGEEGGLAVAAAGSRLGHGQGNGNHHAAATADPSLLPPPLPASSTLPPPSCASPLGTAGTVAPESAVTAREAFSPAASPMKEGSGEADGGEGGKGGHDQRLCYEASSEEERIVVDGLVSLLAAEGAEKEVDRLLDDFPSQAAAAEASGPPPLSSVHTPRGLVLGQEPAAPQQEQGEQQGDDGLPPAPAALLVPPSSPRVGPVHVSQTGVRVLRRRFHDLKALADRCVWLDG